MKRECILYCLHSLEGSDVARDRDGKGEHRFSVLHSAALSVTTMNLVSSFPERS
jgi:hypothetical protein